MQQNPEIAELAAATALRAKINRFFHRQLVAGLLPFEGQWLTPETISAQIQARRRRAKIMLWELLASFVLLSAVGAMFVLVTVLLAY